MLFFTLGVITAALKASNGSLNASLLNDAHDTGSGFDGNTKYELASDAKQSQGRQAGPLQGPTERTKKVLKNSFF